MLILRNDGSAIQPDLAVVANRCIVNPGNRALLADAPSVGFASAGFGRDTKDKVDPHQENEDRFVAEAAEMLAKIASRQKGDVIVVAPPTALGILRKNYNAAVKKRVIAEIAKDFTNHPIDEITRMIMAHQD